MRQPLFLLKLPSRSANPGGKEHIMFQSIANIHSRKGTDSPTDTVTIVEHRDNNHVVAEYRNQRFTAIYNPFSGMYYVDDVYGKIEEEGR
jgi:hypothetical protein